MSRSIMQTVELATGEKVTIIDPKLIQDGSSVFGIVKWGEELPAKTPAGPEHIHIGKRLFRNGEPARLIKLTRNDKGRFKQYWNEAQDGPRPKKPAKKKPAEEGAEKPGPAKKAKKKTTDDTKIIVVAGGDLNKVMKALNSEGTAKKKKPAKK